MNNKLNRTNIKRLKPEKIYLFYDQPILYTCRLENGINYLVILVAKTKHQEEWIYLQISAQRELQLERDELSVFSAIKNPETKVLYKLNIMRDDNFEVYEILPNQLSEDQLPDPDLFLGHCLKDRGEGGYGELKA